jgi:hypothetical protein
VTATTAPQPNRYAGPCTICGTRVQAGQGTWSRAEGAQHLDGQHKTTTKTYRHNMGRARMREARATIEAVYADAGYRRLPSHRVEHADEVTGNGIRATVGGYDRGEVMPNGLRVYRAGQLVLDVPVPRFEIGDYYADMLNQARAIVAILDSAR